MNITPIRLGNLFSGEPLFHDFSKDALWVKRVPGTGDIFLTLTILIKLAEQGIRISGLNNPRITYNKQLVNLLESTYYPDALDGKGRVLGHSYMAVTSGGPTGTTAVFDNALVPQRSSDPVLTGYKQPYLSTNSSRVFTHSERGPFFFTCPTEVLELFRA